MVDPDRNYCDPIHRRIFCPYLLRRKVDPAAPSKGIGTWINLAKMELKATYLSAKGIQYEDPLSKQRFLQIEETEDLPSFLSSLKRSLH